MTLDVWWPNNLSRSYYYSFLPHIQDWQPSKDNMSLPFYATTHNNLRWPAIDVARIKLIFVMEQLNPPPLITESTLFRVCCVLQYCGFWNCPRCLSKNITVPLIICEHE
jgi:hypothetical protein